MLELTRHASAIGQSKRFITEGVDSGLGKVGPYQLTREVGRGASGVVYEATKGSTGARVAIKVIPKGSRTRRKRILREAQALANLQHPGIVQFHGYHDEALNICLVMEFLEGEPLCSRLERGPLRVSEALRIGLDVANAMGEVHRVGIIHRDLKPSNIFFSELGGPRARIIDFGLARRIENPTQITARGAFVGTPQYASPEQCAGNGRELGPETDVYSLGTILYQMLAGVLPTAGGGSRDLVVQQITGTPRALGELVPELDPRLSAIVMRCLEKAPDDRDPMQALENVLRQCLLDLQHDFSLPQAPTYPQARVLPCDVDPAVPPLPSSLRSPAPAASSIPYLAEKIPDSPSSSSVTTAKGPRTRLLPSLMAAALASLLVWAVMAATTSGVAKKPELAASSDQSESVAANKTHPSYVAPVLPLAVKLRAQASAGPPTNQTIASVKPAPQPEAKRHIDQLSEEPSPTPKPSASQAARRDRSLSKKNKSRAPAPRAEREPSRSPAYTDVSVPILY